MNDLHNNCRASRVISPVACGTTGTGLTGEIIDRQDYGGVELVVSYGAVTSSGATVTITVLEGDVTGTMTSVADADLLGTEVLAGLAAGARVDGSTEKVTKRIGYKGNCRYVTVKEVPTATAAAVIGIDAILHSPKVAPTANP